jgi:hypothetical protein
MATSTLTQFRGDDEAAQQIAAGQRQRRGDEEHRAGAIGLEAEAEHVLEVGQAVVAAKTHVVAEEGQHQRIGQRLGDDGEVDAGDAGAEGEPAEDRKARRPATSRPSACAKGKASKPCQYQGSSFQFRKTMKSGSSGLP